MKWVARVLILAGLLIILGATFARSGRPAPVIDASVGVLPSEGQLGSGDPVVFVLDSALDPAFVQGMFLDVPRGEVSHGSLVARVIRSYCRVPVVGLTAEDLGGAADRESYLNALRLVLRFAREHPATRVLVNISLGTEEPDPTERDLIRQITEEGALVVAAAGNENSDSPFYPAAYPETIAVASADRRGKALHSNYGEWIDVAASGDITFIDYEFLPYERLRHEMEARGTSFAAPRVAAAVAWVLRRRPGASPAEAWDTARGVARPLPGEHYEAGRLGAGLLEIYRVKSSVQPTYRWLHYGLPLGFGVLVVVASVVLCVRMGMAGVFISLLIWLLALPAGYALVLLLGRYVEFVQAGYRAEGVLPLLLPVSACFVGALIVRLGRGAMWRGLLPGVALAVVLRLARMEALGRGLVVAAALLAGAALTERWIRRRVSEIGRIPDELPPPAAADALAEVHQNAWDWRMRRAARDAVQRLPHETALARLQSNRTHARGAKALADALQGDGEVRDNCTEDEDIDQSVRPVR